MKLASISHHMWNINSKWIKDLNVSIGVNLGLGFLVMTPKAKPNKENHKFDFVKSFVHQKTLSKSEEATHRKRENIYKLFIRV